MKCFNHQEIDAVGICKSCNKGLCPECAAEVDLSLACKATCIEEVAAIDAQIKRARVTMSAQKNSRMFLPSFFMVLGAIFIAINIYKTSGIDYRTIPGVAFILFGVVFMFINRKWVKEMENENSQAN